MIINELPKTIAIFPLSNAIFFPKTILPLNIFEKRYIQLVSDCMKNNKLFGMVQPKSRTGLKPDVYRVGCLGKVISLNETSDKRFVINLSGIIRFEIKKELKTDKMYREFEVDYFNFMEDLNANGTNLTDQNIKNLIRKLKNFFEKKKYIIQFDELEKLNLDQLIDTVCMISPFSIEEKQKLVEANTIEKKIETLEKIIDFNLFDYFESKTIQ
jgi:hypothetical protein